MPERLVFDSVQTTTARERDRSRIRIRLRRTAGNIQSRLEASYTNVGSAEFGRDFSFISEPGSRNFGTVIFQPGQRTVDISLRVVDDNRFEQDEGIRLRVQPTNSAYGEGSSQPIIVTDDDMPRVYITASSETVTREDESAQINTRIHREGDLSEPLRVDLRRSGTASYYNVDPDYENIRWSSEVASSSIIIPAGQSSLNVELFRVVPDTNPEDNETIQVSIRARESGPWRERYTISRNRPRSSEFTLLNDDFFPLLGTTRQDSLTGEDDRPELIDGRGNRDILTGGQGPDVFGIRHGESSIRQFDSITDFRSGQDRIAVISSNGDIYRPSRLSFAPTDRSASSTEELASNAFLDSNGIANGRQPLGPNAATVIRARSRDIRGTFLLLNDSNPSLSLDRDLLVRLSENNISIGTPISGFYQNTLESGLFY